MIFPTSLHLILCLLFISQVYSDHPKPDEPTCYAPDGKTIADPSLFAPCNRLGITQAGVHSSCCQLNGNSTLSEGPSSSRDLCAITGLCLNNGVVRRGFCTDPSWKSPACVRVCDDVSAGGSPSSFAEMTSCTDGTYCCGRNNLTCCGTSWAVKPPALMVAPSPKATVTVTAIPDTGSSSQRRGNNKTVIVGLSAGLAGVVMVAAGAIWYLVRRIKVLSSLQRSSAQGGASSVSVTGRSTSPGATPLLVSSFERSNLPGGIVSPRTMYHSHGHDRPWGPDAYDIKFKRSSGNGPVSELDSAALLEIGAISEVARGGGGGGGGGGGEGGGGFVQPRPWDERRYRG
ncbi:hypothetical protein QBC43DRAFT_359278 [Cladorrhinum sp. PSN259]|nr:hypothetical protein QBC43DRAFT_359278 [Cladorrhinum sp. PSN259]